MVGSPVPPRAMLSPTQNKQYKQLALSVVQHTACQYLHTIAAPCHSPTTQKRGVDSAKWKAFRRRDDLQVYKTRDVADKTQATVLGVGTIHGSLEDAMYGATTPTELAMYTRSLYLEDQFVAHRVLHDIETPTEEEPFRYLGLKWAARASTALSMVKPRDLVYLEASGLYDVKVARGVQRLGYVVYHSVDINLDAFEAVNERKSSSVHAKMYLCILFRDLGLGKVEVYATLTSEAGGTVPHKLAVISAADAVLSIANVSKSALNKKLAWMLSKAGPTKRHASLRPSRRTKLGVFRQNTTECAVCLQASHPRDTMKRRLVRQRVAAPSVYGPLSVCKACITAAITLGNVSQIAWEEYLATTAWSPKADVEVASSTRGLQEDLMMLSMKVNVADLGLDPEDPEDPQDADTTAQEVCEALAVREIQPEGSGDSVAQERMLLIQQMQALCLQAELTYHITREQSLSLHD